MPTLQKRTCPRCLTYEETYSKAKFCMSCFVQNKKEDSIESEFARLHEWGYTALTDPTYDKHGHRCYTVLTPCGHEWTAPFTNLLKQVKNTKAKNLRPACGVCGPRHRFTNALEAYKKKYARNYNLSQYQDYVKVVRGLSDFNYKHHRHVINPAGLRRGKKTWHLDHKIPIIECFKRGWPVEQAAVVENLQLLKWNENLSKGRVTSK